MSAQILASSGGEYLVRLRGAALNPPEGPGPLEYFQICLAAHFATVATYVPTDVDTKIRGILWRETRDREVLRAMCDYALEAADWDLSPVSRRIVPVEGIGKISGHNGEWLSVIAGAHGRFLALGEADYADKTAFAIDAELDREARGWRAALATPGAELDALRLAAILTHNCGDIDQAVSFWPKGEIHSASRARFHRLAHENRTPYGGAFQRAARLYNTAMAAEGHRNYPLRAVRGLRRRSDLLLPLAPFLDDWGALLASHAALTAEDRVEVLSALVSGCGKVPNQAGYQRALAGFVATSQQAFDAAADRLSAPLKRDLKSLRKQIDIPRISFESAFRKRVTALAGSARHGVREGGPVH